MPNPVLQRELVAHLRSPKAFAMQTAFVLLLGAIVVAAWPAERKIDMTNPYAARQLINLFFIAQFLLASLTAPAFAAGALTGEKERKSYEMLLASALRPSQIVWGKWLASVAPSLLLIVSSLPIVMLCLPLGGVSFYEVAAAYATLVAAIACFSLISLLASAFFARTTAALVTSYLVVLPLALGGLLLWLTFGTGNAEARLILFICIVPPTTAGLLYFLFSLVTRRLWYPSDIGSEGREIVDEKQELREAVGLVLRRDEFPDRLFAPPKRIDILPDGVNPVLDKELRSELFSQGTLMLRLVIQISLLLAVPMMGACLYFRPPWAPWYIAYVLLFNMLVGPVFSAGSVSSERERRTLDLLLVTTLSPGQILWGKLFSGLRISTVLTMFLMWPLVLACLMVPEYYGNLPTFALMFVLVAATCAFTSIVSLFCSVCFQKSNVSLTVAYLSIACLFLLGPAADYFGRSFFPETVLAQVLHALTAISPFSAAFSLPLEMSLLTKESRLADWPIFLGHLAFQAIFLALLLKLMMLIFRNRYDAAGGI
ncbi:MAG: ABC transporter permease subunit [Planctomycetia bacterium]|nr:ABC transporter permease subunit [Planctomycetia bacterium]